MKVMLLIVAILMFSLNGFAKTKVQKKSWKKDPYSFDINVYYKLKFVDRAKYLQLYVDFIKEVEANKQAKHKSDFDLYQLLFPTAEAAGEKPCLTGGIYYTPPCGALTNTTFPDELKVAFSGCTSNNRCAAYFGLDASGGGLCFKTEGNATTECANQSSPEAVQRLNQAMANQYDAKSRALQKALDIDLKQNAFINQYCLDKSTKGKACTKLASGVAEFDKKAGGTGTDLVSDQTGKGCTNAEIQAVGGERGQTPHPVWYHMLKMASLSCGKSFEEVQRTLGVCKVDATFTLEQMQADVEGDLRSKDNLRAAVNELENGRKPAKGDQWNSFTDYFGLTPDEYKTVFCSNSSGKAYKAGTNLNSHIAGGTSAARKRRDVFSKCLKSTIEKKDLNENGETVTRYLSKDYYSVCRFKPATARFDDISAHPEKYRGKYFFSDNATGNCYALDKASNSCRSIGSLQQCAGKTPPSNPTPGTISGTNSFFSLEPVYKSDNSNKVVDLATLSSQFMFYEYDCGSSATQPCGADNNYCRDMSGVSQ